MSCSVVLLLHQHRNNLFLFILCLMLRIDDEVRFHTFFSLLRFWNSTRALLQRNHTMPQTSRSDLRLLPNDVMLDITSFNLKHHLPENFTSSHIWWNWELSSSVRVVCLPKWLRRCLMRPDCALWDQPSARISLLFWLIAARLCWNYSWFFCTPETECLAAQASLKEVYSKERGEDISRRSVRSVSHIAVQMEAMTWWMLGGIHTFTVISYSADEWMVWTVYMVFLPLFCLVAAPMSFTCDIKSDLRRTSFWPLCIQAGNKEPWALMNPKSIFL